MSISCDFTANGKPVLMLTKFSYRLQILSSSLSIRITLHSFSVNFLLLEIVIFNLTFAVSGLLVSQLRDSEIRSSVLDARDWIKLFITAIFSRSII